MDLEEEMSEKARPVWWPESPYPEDVFPMTIEEYVEAIPDPALRSAISGSLARWAWGVADEMIYEAYDNSRPRATFTS